MAAISMGQLSQSELNEICQECLGVYCSTRNFSCNHKICNNCSLAPIGKVSRRCPICEKTANNNTSSNEDSKDSARPRSFSNFSSSTLTCSSSSPPLFSASSPTTTRNYEQELNSNDQAVPGSPSRNSATNSPSSIVLSSPGLSENGSSPVGTSPINFGESPYTFLTTDDGSSLRSQQTITTSSSSGFHKISQNYASQPQSSISSMGMPSSLNASSCSSSGLSPSLANISHLKSNYASQTSALQVSPTSLTQSNNYLYPSTNYASNSTSNYILSELCTNLSSNSSSNYIFPQISPNYVPQSSSYYSSNTSVTSTHSTLVYSPQISSYASHTSSALLPQSSPTLLVSPASSDFLKPAHHHRNLVAHSSPPLDILLQSSAPLQPHSPVSHLSPKKDVENLSAGLQGDFLKCQHSLGGETMKYYCLMCRILYCQFCYSEHSQHDVLQLQSYEYHISRIFDSLLSTVSRRQSQVQSSLSKVSEYIHQLESVSNQSEGEINEAFNHMAGLLELRRNSMLKSIGEVKLHKMSQLKEQQDVLRNASQTLNRAKGALEFQQRSDLGTRLNIKNFVEDELKGCQGVRHYLHPIEEPLLNFNHETMEMSSKLVTFGKVITDSSPKHCELVGVNMKMAFLKKSCSVSLFCRDMLGQRVTKGGEEVKAIMISGETQLPVELKVVDNGNGKYRIYFCPFELTSPTIRVFLRDQEVLHSSFQPIITVPKEYSHIEDREIVFGNKTSCGKKLERPWGIHCDPDGYIYASDRMNHCIHVFNPDRSLHHRFGSFGYYPSQLNRPAGITVDNKRRIIVADKDNHRIQIFSFEGELIHFFGGRGNNDGEFFYPWGIDTNHEGCILVSDTRNHRIQMFDSEGKFLSAVGGPNQKIVSGIIEAPRGVKFGPGGNIYVSDFNLHHIVIIEGFMTKNPRFHAFGGNYQEVLRDINMQNGGSRSGHASNGNHHPVCLSPEDDEYSNDLIPSQNVGLPNTSPRATSQYQGRANLQQGSGPRHRGNNYNRNENPNFEILRDKLDLFRPQGMTFDWNGNLMVTDSRHSRINIYTPEGKPIHILDLTQDHPLIYDRGGKVLDNSEKPVDLAISPVGIIYVMEQQYDMIKELK